MEFFTKYPIETYRSGELLLTSPLAVQWWWLIGAAIVVMVIASVGYGYRTEALDLGKKTTLGTLQILVFAVLGLVMAQPVLQIQSLKAGANSVLVLIDDSASMSFPESADRTRLAAATTLAGDLTERLAATAEVQTFSFAGSASRLPALSELTGAGASSRLGQSLADVLAAGQNSALVAVIVISDGADTSTGESLASVVGAGVPVHTLGLGSTQLESETLIEDVRLQSEAPINSRVRADVTLRHSGGDEALVRVLDGGRLLAAKQITLADEQELVRTELVFDSGRQGIRDLTFEIVAQGADTLVENNQLRRLLSVRQRQRNVMYLEGEPRWEYKFLRRAMAGDDVVSFKSLLKTSDRKTYRQGVTEADELAKGLPAVPEELFAFDLVILGSMGAAELSDQQHQLLQRFVAQRGGSLLVLAGRRALADGGWDSRPLADMLPVQMAATPSFGPLQGRAQVSRQGALNSWTVLPEAEGSDPWASLPALVDYQSLGALKPAASVLLEFVDEASSATLPLLVTQPYGLGTVALLATSSTWRWQMRTPEGDPRHGLFWRQLLRQLAELSPQPEQISIRAGEDSIDLHMTLRDRAFEPAASAGVSAEVTRPDGSSSDLPLQAGGFPGEVNGFLSTPDAGVYRVDVSLADGNSVTQFVSVGGGDLEYRSPVQNVALLQRLAEATGGQYWTPANASGIVDAIRYSSSGIQERLVLPLWDLPLWLLLIIGIKVLEWLLRRRWGRI